MFRRLIAVAVLAFGVAFAVPVAQADTGDIIEPQSEPPTAKDGFQAGTCEEDEPPATLCTPETPSRLYVQAAGHPPMGYTQYIIRHKEEASPFGLLMPIIEPREDRSVKTLRVDLPPGLTVNPQATGEAEQCPLAAFEFEVGEFTVPQCEPSTIVGREEVTLVVNTANAVPAPSPPFPPGSFLPVGFVLPPSEETGTKVPLYNLVPKDGEPALFGFVVAGKEKVFLETEVAWEGDYHQSFTIRPPEPSIPFSTLKSRLISKGRSGDGSFVTTPTTCFNPELPPYEQTYSTFYRAESYGEPNPTFPAGSTPFEAPLPPGVIQLGCKQVPFDPSLEVEPGTAQADSPAKPTVVTRLPVEPEPETRAQSHLRNAEIVLPQGMGLNPSAANGLQSCSDAQFGKGTRDDIACPAASRIGTAEVESPPLPAGSLKGDVYLGQQLSRDPASGQEFRLFVAAESDRYGISARLIGNVKADPATGQLTTTFAENPQVPFESVTLRLDGAGGVLTSPPVCGVSQATSTMEPWSTPSSTRSPSDEFSTTAFPGGGPCPTTLAARPFAPSYAAASDNPRGGRYSPFRVDIGRADGEQELKAVDVTLPEGLTGDLSGIPYCSDDALRTAAGRSGLAEQASPSCPAASAIGTTTTRAGSGAGPISLGGAAYLAGPYGGAPLSMGVITPAVAGPFDLGVVVVRVALEVEPESTQIRAVSDPIPDVYGGVKLDLRSVHVDVDRARFMRNPTDCGAKATSGALAGGGANPADPATWSSYPVSAPFRARDCGSLRFKPKLFAKLLGGKAISFRGRHPKLRVVLEAREGDADFARSALVLPPSLFLDQGNIRTVCTRPQLATRTCPKRSIYGYARAISPLLDQPLKGPVYLVSSNNELPDLLADLRGQVNVRLRGVIGSQRGGLKTVFRKLPDVPVEKFLLWMEGGRKRGLIVNSQDLCRTKKRTAYLNLKAQNGRLKKVKRLRINLGAACFRRGR
jgi:hypothetical protein